MSEETDYERAKNLVKEHFGNEMKIAAYLEKALGWPITKSEDVGSLHAFSLILRGCCNMMDGLHYMEEINMPSNVRLIVMKLPYKLRERWRVVACELQERRAYRAVFLNLVNFIERQVKILLDPLFGNVQETQPHDSVKYKVMPKSLIKERSHATVAAINTFEDIKSTEQQAQYFHSVHEQVCSLLCWRIAAASCC